MPERQAGCSPSHKLEVPAGAVFLNGAGYSVVKVWTWLHEDHAPRPRILGAKSGQFSMAELTPHAIRLARAACIQI